MHLWATRFRPRKRARGRSRSEAPRKEIAPDKKGAKSIKGLIWRSIALGQNQVKECYEL